MGTFGIALVNGAADPGRRRYTLARELGHHLLADEYTPDLGLGSTRSERESLINEFAIHFLMPRLDVTSRWEELAPDIEDRRRRLIVIAAEYRVSWTAALSQAVRLELITRAELDCFDVNRPTRPDYIELGVRFQTELDPMSLPLSFEQAAFRAYRRSLVTSDRLVELLRQTVAVDDLPPPFDTPIESLDAEFESLT